MAKEVAVMALAVLARGAVVVAVMEAETVAVATEVAARVVARVVAVMEAETVAVATEVAARVVEVGKVVATEVAARVVKVEVVVRAAAGSITCRSTHQGCRKCCLRTWTHRSNHSYESNRS